MTPSPRTCRDCGTSIAHRAKQARRCEPCAYADKHRPRTPGPRVCAGCGRDIAYRHWAAKRCEACAVAEVARMKAGELANAEVRYYRCHHCGTQFTRLRTDSLYCQRSCWARHRLEQARGARPDVICGWCARPFRPVRSDALYCGSRCVKAAWYAVNTEQAKAKATAWLAANPDARRAIAAGDKARRKGAPGPGVSARDWARLVARYRGCCAYCGAKAEPLHMDHVVPIVRGGRHSIGNVVPACEGCNLSKHASYVVEWRQRIRRRAIRAAAQRPDDRVAPEGGRRAESQL